MDEFRALTDEHSSVTDVQYRGHFHDLMVDDILKGLAAEGSTVIKNIKILGINGVIAIPDGASKPEGQSLGYFIEVKTGDNPSFTENQKYVYPLICLGGHATSLDPRVTQLGVTPGAPFPPMEVILIVIGGSGQVPHWIDYCDFVRH